MRFTIFTHVEHIKESENYYGYSPYIREMNIWLKHVKEVEVVAPAPFPKFGDPKGVPSFAEAYQHSKFVFTPIPSFNVLNITSTFSTLFKIPLIFFRILGSMQQADHIHLRCPGNIGLISCFVQMLFPSKPKTAKYAGNWDPEAKQPWSYKLQKKILSNTFITRNMKVLVYGNWPGQSKNILPFFTASFSENEKTKVEKKFTSPFTFLFVGGLVEGKRPLFAIHLVERLMARGIPVKLDLYGGGSLRKELQEYVEQKNLEPFITFHGNRKLEELKEAYKKAHFLILASKSEGWPKAVAEAMFFGCIPVATAVSCVPWMLNYGKRGILISDENKKADIENGGQIRVVRGQRAEGKFKVQRSVFSVQSSTFNVQRSTYDVENKGMEKLIKEVQALMENPEEMKRMSMAAQEWSQEYTLERFEEAIKKILKV